jgi:anti-sigma regulatory factor (Ser/Thr protein kinase)
VDDEALLSLDLPSRPEAPAAARKALTSLNGALHLISSERLRDAQLLISEIVANAVRHGSPDTETVGIRVRATEAVMRVEVTDAGKGFDPARTPGHSLDGSGGWGLEIVAALAHRWGVEQEAAMTVWFEISRPQHDEPLAVQPTDPQ